jgi:hypothetical protein
MHKYYVYELLLQKIDLDFIFVAEVVGTWL